MVGYEVGTSWQKDVMEQSCSALTAENQTQENSSREDRARDPI